MHTSSRYESILFSPDKPQSRSSQGLHLQHLTLQHQFPLGIHQPPDILGGLVEVSNQGACSILSSGLQSTSGISVNQRIIGVVPLARLTGEEIFLPEHQDIQVNDHSSRTTHFSLQHFLIQHTGNLYHICCFLFIKFLFQN